MSKNVSHLTLWISIFSSIFFGKIETLLTIKIRDLIFGTCYFKPQPGSTIFFSNSDLWVKCFAFTLVNVNICLIFFGKNWNFIDHKNHITVISNLGSVPQIDLYALNRCLPPLFMCTSLCRVTHEISSRFHRLRLQFWMFGYQSNFPQNKIKLKKKANPTL